MNPYAHIPAGATSSHMAVQKAPRLPKTAFVVNHPAGATVGLLFLGFCFESIVAPTCTLAKAESVCPRVAENASPQTLRR